MKAGLGRLRRELRYWRGRLIPHTLPRRSQKPNISNVTRVDISAELCVEAYWLEFQREQGPAASVYVLDQEVMRFDCFGPGVGHLHVNLLQHNRYLGTEKSRIYFVAKDVESQIEESVHWLRSNLPFCLITNHSQAIRSLQLPEDAADLAADAMSDALLAVQREMQHPRP